VSDARIFDGRSPLLRGARIALLVFSLAACTGRGEPLRPRGLCVRPGGGDGCFATIAAAVAAAAAGESISVQAGVYQEMVSIRKPVTLVGNDSFSQPSTVDAAGFGHGFLVSGVGAGTVVIRDFEVRDARHEGILVENSSGVVLESNYVHANGKDTGGCPGAWPGAPRRCAAGIHLRAVRQSTVLDNEVSDNPDGLLITDETGESSHNLIAHNTARASRDGCGVLLSSAPACRRGTGGAIECGDSDTDAFGVFANAISANAVEDNHGCGIGIFAQSAGVASANAVTGSIIRENGAAGVALRADSSIRSVANTLISGNIISTNGAEPGVTPLPAGIAISAPRTPVASDRPGAPGANTITIAQNTINDEKADVFVATADGAGVNVFMNDLLGSRGVLGVGNGGAGAINAMGNYWNCATGPGSSAACSSVQGPVLTNPALPNSLPEPIINLTASAFLGAN
jgi:hypothetical protein